MKKLFYFASVAALALSSCTKDSTEIAPVQGGEAAFSAYMEVGSTTRHHMEPTTDANGKVTYPFVYDAGDMVAVNSDAQLNKNLPFITVLGGSPAVFKAVGTDISYLGTTGNYYMTYPWCDKTNVSDLTYEDDEFVSAVINGLAVPAEQRYAEDSFATMTAPAFMVAKASDVTAEQVLGFKSAASYFQVPVTGVGQLQKLALSIIDDNGQSVDLSAGITVNVYAENDDEESYAPVGDFYYQINNLPDDARAVTVDFGATPLDLNPVEATNIVFVINSNFKLEGANVTYIATMLDEEGEEDDLPPMSYFYPSWASASNQVIGKVENQWENIAPNMLFFGKPANFGVEGYPVNNVVDFITWAYVNWNKNYDTTTDTTVDVNNAWIVQAEQAGIIVPINPSQYDYTNAEDFKFQPAIILADLDFAEVTGATPASDLQKAAWAWFNNNKTNRGTMIATLKGAEIIGNDFTLSNLEVDGNAFMAADAQNVSSKISNATLQNFSIEAAEDVDNVYFFGVNKPGREVETDEVTIDGGSLNGGKADAKKTIVGTAYASAFEGLAVENWPLVGTDKAPYANLFSMDTDADLSELYAANANAIIELRGNTIKPGAVAVVNDVENIVETVMESVNLNNTWFSVVIDEVSYWTGVAANQTRRATGAEKDNVYAAILTAEEFVTLASDNGPYGDITMTNDIDLRNIALGAKKNINNKVVKGANKTVKNVYITNKVVTESKAADGTVTEKVTYTQIANGDYYTLFGREAEVENLNVDALTIEVQANYKYSAVAGLAYEGKAKNVTVTTTPTKIDVDELGGLILTVPATGFKAEQLETPVGVVFGKANAADIEDVFVKASITNANVKAFTKAPIGLVAGQLIVADDATVKAAYTSQGGVNNTDITMMKDGSFDATQLYSVDEDGNISPAANVYSGKLFGTVNVTGIPTSTTEKHIRDFHVVAPANAPTGWSAPNKRHVVGGFTFDILNEDFHLDINFYNDAYEQDLAYVEPEVEEDEE